jgi:hypothetical protein
MPEDAKEAIGNGVRAKRSKSGAISFDLLEAENNRAALCRGHHREVHRCSDEAAWWNKAGVDPTASARALWLKSHPLPATPANVAAAAPVIDNGP